MRKIFTFFFFGFIIVGFIVIQYCWITTLQKDKFSAFKSSVVSGVHDVATTLPNFPQTLTTTAVTSALQTAFAAKNLGVIPVEFNLVLGKVHRTSSGFHQPSSNNLTLTYLFQQKGGFLTVMIPAANSLIWKQMGWIIALSALLTLMVVTIFYYAAKWNQSLESNRDTLLQNMMQQLESPLSTVSVAVEALRNATVMRDVAMIKFYRQVINEENRRMNEEVKRLLRELR